MNLLKKMIKEDDKLNVHVLTTIVGAVVGVVLGYIVNRTAEPEVVELLEDETWQSEN